jgi:hypothetical protein
MTNCVSYGILTTHRRVEVACKRQHCKQGLIAFVEIVLCTTTTTTFLEVGVILLPYSGVCTMSSRLVL